MKKWLMKHRNGIRFWVGEFFVILASFCIIVNKNEIGWGTSLAIAAFLFGMNYEQVWITPKEVIT